MIELKSKRKIDDKVMREVLKNGEKALCFKIDETLFWSLKDKLVQKKISSKQWLENQIRQFITTS